MDQSNHRHRFNNTLFKCVYAVVVTLTTTPTLAQEQPAVSNTGPQILTGNVTNQVVQVLQGPLQSTHMVEESSVKDPPWTSHPSSWLEISWDPETYETGRVMGLSLGFNFPLDGSLQERWSCSRFFRRKVTDGGRQGKTRLNWWDPVARWACEGVSSILTTLLFDMLMYLSFNHHLHHQNLNQD